jgi:hypothetical protein
MAIEIRLRSLLPEVRRRKDAYNYDVSREIAATVEGFMVVIGRTVPVGTRDEIQRIIHEERAQPDVAVGLRSANRTGPAAAAVV